MTMETAGLGGPPPNPPYHLVNRVTGKHLGPFSSHLDGALARYADDGDTGWKRADIMDNDQFDEYLDSLVTQHSATIERGDPDA